MPAYAAARSSPVTSSGGRGANSYDADTASPAASEAEKPALARSGDAAVSTVTDASKPVLARSSNAATPRTTNAGKPRLTRTGVSPTMTTSAGVIIPGDFIALQGQAVNPDGEPLERPGYIVTKSNFAVAGEVDGDGSFTLSLLQATYTDFVFITDETDEYGLVWYEADPVRVSPRDDRVTIPFTPAEPEQGGGGLFVGGGINFG